MGNLKVPESPTTYTTHYEDLKGIDCYNPNTEISGNHAADMVNMYPEGGIPVKRRGWRKIQELDSDIVTAYYDAYNDKTYVATETTLAVKDGTLDVVSTQMLGNSEITVDTNISFKLKNFVQTVTVDEPYKGISMLTATVHYSRFYKHKNLTSYLQSYFSFDAYDNIVITAEDFYMLMGIHDEDIPQVTNITLLATYTQTTSLAEISTTSAIKHIIPFDSEIYFWTGSDIKTLSGSTLSPISHTVPVTKFSLNPDGSGGQSYYSVNAMTQEQSYLFHGDGSALEFKPHGDGFNSPDVTHIFEITKVELFNGVDWDTLTVNTDYTIVQGTNDYYLLDTDGSTVLTRKTDWYVKFPSGHAPANMTIGDNVKVTVKEYDVEVKETVNSNPIRWGKYNRLMHKILDSDINIVYGAVDSDRVFVVVDSNRIYYSESGDISYFPDDNYIVAGNHAPIVGLHRKDDSLVAVTGESDTHAVYIIKSSTAVVTDNTLTGEGGMDATSHEEQFFSVHPSASGKGAIAGKSFATLVDDPLYLGAQGVYSISSNYYTSQTMIVNKSTFINPKLLAEPNLKDAIACIWKHFYCIFINAHVYLFDSNNVTRDTAGNRCYEAYYLENIPVTNCVLPAGDELYFANGKYWCKFNADIDGHDAYYDDGTYDDSLHIVSGDQIVWCRWVGKLDDDNYPQYFKNLSKKGVVVTVLAQDESTVNIYLSKDGDEYIQTAKMADMETDDITIDIYPLKKIKKYKRLRFMIENDEPEPFGLVKIVKTWTLGNYAK